jgi:K+/H+ antiporter YhaU regulatory subunit KhtT
MAGRFHTIPSAQDFIRTGDTLIVLGARDQVDRLEAL